MNPIIKLLTAAFFLIAVSICPAQSQNANLEPSLNAMEWRFIGPIAGNRGSVVLGHPTKQNEFYHGASNGLWKTEDAGIYWEPVGDEYFKSGNIGAMEFSESSTI